VNAEPRCAKPRCAKPRCTKPRCAWAALLSAWDVQAGSPSEAALATAVLLDAHRHPRSVVVAAQYVLGRRTPGVRHTTRHVVVRTMDELTTGAVSAAAAAEREAQ
jgi:hypothetical protein